MVQNILRIKAEDVKVVPTDEEPTPSVKKIGERPENVMDTPDDWVIDMKDVLQNYPDIASTLKKDAFKGGAKQITVKKLKSLLETIDEDDDQFWVSIQNYTDSDTGQNKWSITPQVAIQLNVSDKVRKMMRENPIAGDFFDEFFSYTANTWSGRHPAHTQTLAWARVYRYPDKWIIEELQSDLFGATTKVVKDHDPKGEIARILKKFTMSEQAEIGKFIAGKFKDWDKQLIGLIVSMARKAGIKDIYMFDEDFKKSYMKGSMPGRGEIKVSKTTRFYETVPRDLGFRKGKLIGPDDKEYSTWHRAVASLTF